MHSEIKEKRMKTNKQSISQIHYAFDQAHQHLVYCTENKRLRVLI